MRTSIHCQPSRLVRFECFPTWQANPPHGQLQCDPQTLFSNTRVSISRGRCLVCSSPCQHEGRLHMFARGDLRIPGKLVKVMAISRFIPSGSLLKFIRFIHLRGCDRAAINSVCAPSESSSGADNTLKFRVLYPRLTPDSMLKERDRPFSKRRPEPRHESWADWRTGGLGPFCMTEGSGRTQGCRYSGYSGVVFHILLAMAPAGQSNAPCYPQVQTLSAMGCSVLGYPTAGGEFDWTRTKRYNRYYKTTPWPTPPYD